MATPRTQDYTVTGVWRVFGGMQRFSTGDKPSIILRICWVMITTNLFIIPDITAGYTWQCVNMINME